MSPAPRGWIRPAAALVLAKAAVSLAVLAFGFTHVSDDDYARVVIAQGFAVAPRLDPSGTSWLPAPFWAMGAAMILTGRSLLAARVVAVVLGALSPLPAFFALRRSGVGRTTILVGLGLAFASPWSAWCGATTVPDGWTAALVAAAAFGLISDETVLFAAGCAAMAALARYEAWPLCAVVAVRAVVLLGTRRVVEARAKQRTVAALLVALAAPLGWMAWNHYAHGDALHFLARVATFRRQLGAAEAPLGAKLAEYPHALWDEAPEALLLGAVAILGLLASPAALRACLRTRWIWPLVAAAAVTLFLVVGDVRDGAPTHHAVRPLLGVVAILVVAGVDTLGEVFRVFPPAPRGVVLVVFAVLSIAVLARDVYAYRAPPGIGDSDRSAQLQRGSVLRGTAGPVDVLHVTPCAYEHFALLASFGAPERAVIEPSRAAGSDGADDECPRVTVEAR